MGRAVWVRGEVQEEAGRESSGVREAKHNREHGVGCSGRRGVG